MKMLLPEQNLKTFIDDTVITVFDTMLAMEIEPSAHGALFSTQETQIIGMVGLAGAFKAVVCLRVPESYSARLARTMTGASPNEYMSDADINDVIGELANIIAGKLKSCFHSNGPCNLSLPTIIRGHHLDLESVSGTDRHSFTFRPHNQLVVVEFYSLHQKGNAS
jgi:flagellar motor switch protein FliN